MTQVSMFGLPTLAVEIVGDHVHSLTHYLFETSRMVGEDGAVSHYAAVVYARLPFGSDAVYRNEGAASVPTSRLIESGSRDPILAAVPGLFKYQADTKASWDAFLREKLLPYVPAGRILVLWISEDGATETSFVVS